MNTRSTTFGFLAAAATLAGCAGMETNPALERAQSDVSRAQSDPAAAEAAETRLQSAREHLETARMLWEEEGNSATVRVEHEALLASRNAEIALTQADIARNQEAIDEAETVRAELLAEAREREAQRAEREAQRAQREAERAEQLAETREQQADRAQGRIEQLSEQLAAERTNRGLVLTLGDVLFETDRAELKPGANDTVARVAEFLGEYADRRALIEGHTDSRGSDEYNRQLSERRAQSMHDALVSEGIDPSRLSVRGMGEQAPVATNDTAAGRQENRRVEIVISDEDGTFPAGAPSG